MYCMHTASRWSAPRFKTLHAYIVVTISALGQANLAVLCFVLLLNTNGDYNLQNIHHVVFSELYK